MRLSPVSRLAGALALAGVLAVPAARAADFTTTDGYTAACREVAKGAVPRDDDARIAAVICRDTALVRQIVTWGTQGFERIHKDRTSNDAILVEVTKEIDYVIAELGATRKLLAQVKLGKRKSLRLAPAQWELDLDSDGQVKLWEKYLFALPKRGHQAFRFSGPSNDQEYYDREYNLGAVIRVDQSDILWSLSYHHFIEGLLTNVRAFDLAKDYNGVILARPALLKAAHQLIGNGFLISGKMRQEALAETDDDEEWIGHPGQASSVFPLPLDAADFASWGMMIKEMSALWQGRSLLPATQGGSGMLAAMAPLCPEGSGLNVARVYLQPPPAGTLYGFRHTKLPTAHCQRIDKAHPVSPLAQMAEQASKSQTGMGFLRYLYWTN
ncbi:hypothetical protein IV454_00150 [Massilia antarctica]|uniref:Uncharacterized protein n=1 Tax=Massilia antarctica TaxID=2765360 RepID=A0AA48WCM0_9BURK|nr:hypothetical protein [Massilia antarctica]QPI50066.1 hypothetical protein IV454_32520 [Massilia antarctica]QPI50096.1 hypothetical protein IV454_00150 [Massilia antarctica]